jgi:hypothetical protein
MGKNLFDDVHFSFQQYVAAEPHHHVTFALWALHTHAYQKFEYTPRLALQSPAPNSGKTTVLRVLRLLTPEQEFLIDPTAATLFRLMSQDKTLLLDEMDNVRIERNLLAILNHGHQKGGTVPRVIKREGSQMAGVHTRSTRRHRCPAACSYLSFNPRPDVSC